MMADSDTPLDPPARSDVGGKGEQGRVRFGTGPCGSHSGQWFCAEVLHAQERRAQDELTKQGFPVFLPLVLERRHFRDGDRERTRVVHALMFPGYVFVFFDVATPGWRKVSHTRGIARLLGTHPERPQPVPAAVMDLVQDMQARRDAELRAWLEHPIAPDAAVRVKVGPWAGFDGVCLWSKGDRIRVLMRLFGRETQVEMPLNRVEKVEQS